MKRNNKWNKNCQLVDAYVKEHGVKVPVEAKIKDGGIDIYIGEWLRRQKKLAKLDRLDQEKYSKLEKIDQNIFTPNEILAWESMFEELNQFVKKLKEKNKQNIKRRSTKKLSIPNVVPYNEPKYKKLRSWCDKQIKDATEFVKKQNKWTVARKEEWCERRARLEERVNFQFPDKMPDIMFNELYRLTRNWEENYELDYAKEYKKRKDREEELTEKNYERDPDLIDISQYHPEDIHLEGKYE